MNTQAWDLREDDRRPPNELLEIVQRGLRARPKRLPSWLFYDERGSRLFEAICEQPEYYLTRCEIALLEGVAKATATSPEPRRLLALAYERRSRERGGEERRAALGRAVAGHVALRMRGRRPAQDDRQHHEQRPPPHRLHGTRRLCRMRC